MFTGDSHTSSSGIVHRARSWLEHSLSLPRNQHCPLLWRLYLQLEVGIKTAHEHSQYLCLSLITWGMVKTRKTLQIWFIWF